MNNQESIHYAGLELEREAEARKDPDWIQQQWDRPECRVLLLHKDRNLMRWQRDSDSSPVAVSHPREEVDNLLEPDHEIVFLGLKNHSPLFAVDISQSDSAHFDSIVGECEFIDLREAGWLLSAQEAALLAYTRGLLYWHRHSGYCSTCGSPALSRQGGHLRLCSNQQCERMIFPRTDPAVIMLVEHRPATGPAKCLLARNSQFAARMMSTLAGFVDPSESLEDTVIREVYEEAGIRVEQVVYQASQPWPFPSSIMLGFRAQALNTDIRIDGAEIEEAQWFSASELRNFGEWGDGSSGYCLPRKDSIARFLIESWIKEMSTGAKHPGRRDDSNPVGARVFKIPQFIQCVE